ncbi:hypothetical protein BGX30_004979, partial [Mortierella sp. GBA39]
MDDSIFFLTANVTRWNSKFHLVERVYEYRAVLETTAQELQQRRDGPKEEREKFKEFQNQLLSAEELDVLAEAIGLLRPAADFTHWAGGSDYSPISQVYEKVHRLLPPVTTLQTEGAQQMYMRLKLLIDSVWPLDEISDGMLLAMYFNHGCAGSEIWGRENANQVTENAAEDAAEARSAIATTRREPDKILPKVLSVVELEYLVKSQFKMIFRIHSKIKTQTHLQVLITFQTKYPTRRRGP